MRHALPFVSSSEKHPFHSAALRWQSILCVIAHLYIRLYIWYINFTFVDRIYWIWIGFPNFIHIDCGTVSQIRHPLMVSKIDYVIVLLVVDRSPLSVWAIHSDIQFIDGLDSGGMMAMMAMMQKRDIIGCHWWRIWWEEESQIGKQCVINYSI